MPSTIKRCRLVDNENNDLHDPNDVMLDNGFRPWLYQFAKEAEKIDKNNAVILKKAARIALIHSEISESLEGIRKQMRDKHLPKHAAEVVELADAVIRIFDYIGGYHKDCSFEDIINEKLEYNLMRSDHKIEDRDKPSGKKI